MGQISQEAAKLSENFKQAFAQLNAEQKSAVEQIEGPVMVLAGPGTGKTQVLSLRIANILHNQDLQVDPQNILCLTFTDSGVHAMRQRLMQFIGSAAYKVGVFTFHSFCNEVIQNNYDKFCLQSQIDELEKIQIVQGLIDKLKPGSALKPFGDHYFYVRDLLRLISALKNENIKPEDFARAVSDFDAFFQANQEILESFAGAHVRQLKEADCENFLANLTGDFRFIELCQSFYERSDRIKTFRDEIKLLYNDGMKALPRQKEASQIYQAYQESLERGSLYDYEDMILAVIKAFETDPGLLAGYQERFQYIHVDEYQDTNGAQNRTIELLTGFFEESANVFVVGDDDQSIFRFQGASIENIFYFYKRYAGNLNSVVLKNNYRSQQNILDLAQVSIRHNQARITKLIPDLDKELVSVDAAAVNQAVQVLSATTQYEETHWLVNQIQSLIQAGTPAESIAVIYRENKDAEVLIEMFARLGIAHNALIGEDILQDLNLAQLIDLLRVINNPLGSSHLIFNLLNYNFVFFSKDIQGAGITVRDIIELSYSRKKEEAQSLMNIMLEHDKFKAFAAKLLEFHRLEQNYRLDVLLERVVNEFSYLEYIFTLPDKIKQSNNLQTLFDRVKSLVRSKGLSSQNIQARFSLKDFLEYVDLLETNKIGIKPLNFASEASAVNLLTAHRSKGLEFDHVFIFSCRDKLWGNKRSVNRLKLPPFLIKETQALIEHDALEEERRLFFVAMTRAKKTLTISYHQENSNGKAIEKSVFVTELLQAKDLPVDFCEYQAGESQTLQRLEDSFRQPGVHYDEAGAYIKSILQDYQLSVTHLNNYLDCPKKFFYQNLVRVPAAKDKFAAMGTAVHAALYDMFSSFKLKNMSMQECCDLACGNFIEHLEAQRLPESEYKECLHVGREMLSAYVQKYYASFSSGVLLEKDFSFAGLTVDGYRITGRLDKIEINDDDKANVVDYKTGRPRREELKPGGKSHRQIVFYQLLCDEAKASKCFDYQMVSGELDYLREDDRGELRKFRIDVTEGDLLRLKAEIKDFYENLEQINFPLTEDLDLCSKCAFKNLCGR